MELIPIQKAKALVDRFAKLPEEGSLMWYLSFEIAKKCALIAVNEILNNDNNLMNTYSQNDYWQEVKQEIEKL